MKDITLEDVLDSEDLKSLIVIYIMNYIKKAPDEKEYEYLRQELANFIIENGWNLNNLSESYHKKLHDEYIKILSRRDL